ncbi:hypothetical protein HMP0015_0886 [Acinetobacter haemolyticus ATCC 19194]|uniref:Uncharacterized protein n=1 Tax=Acinetobacter haemolyticus ATCC 19194 TaxID=707232 RepID=D4XME4_ACIHA|nr:hypothetical protein HMP0015_0886 [Acinetobacter haemolyticus ATCC 19194]
MILSSQIIINGKDCTLKQQHMHIKENEFQQKSDRKYKLSAARKVNSYP